MKLSKLFSAAAAGLILTSSMVGSVFANALSAGNVDELTDGTFTYELNKDNEYTIVDCDGSATVEKIPSIVNGYAVVAIGEDALAGCTFISELSIPSSVKTIGKGAFASCSSLKKVKLSDRLTEIPEGAFMGCANLTDITIPESIEVIGTGAFYGCESLEKIELPDSITAVNDYAFQRCYALGSMDIPSSVTSFAKTALIECPSISEITAEGNTKYKVEDNVLYTSDGKTLMHAAAAALSGPFYVPEGVTEIGSGAFEYCSEITAVFISSTVSKVGDAAFRFCTSLTSIDFPAVGVTELGPLAFENCIALTSVSLPKSLKTVSAQAFSNAEKLEKVILAEGTEAIDEAAFFACPSLKSIIIPKSVKSVGKYAFGYTMNSEGTEYKAVDGFSMSVYSGSAAEKYAKSEKIECAVVDRSLKRVAFIVIGVGLLLAAAVFAVTLMKRGKKLAPTSVRKAEAEEKEAESYENIVSEDSDE